MACVLLFFAVRGETDLRKFFPTIGKIPPMNPAIQDHLSRLPVLRYFPFESGKYDVSTPGLFHLQVETETPEKRLFQIDQSYPLYLQNKAHCRQENINKYYLEQDLDTACQRLVNQTIVDHLCRAYPQWFQFEQQSLNCSLSGDQLKLSAKFELQEHPLYLNLFDALASQLQEDLAIWQLQGDRDSLVALHVCAPNFWAPAEKIGKTFAEVHQHVPGMAAQRGNYLPMLKGLIQKPAFCRFIWDLNTSSRLNHHPLAPVDILPENWPLPPFSLAAPELYVRVERQLLCGLPACQAVLFAIRTYLYPVQALDLAGLQGLASALQSMPPALLEYKNLADSREAIQSWLKQLIAQKRATFA
ncbi:MAG: DUF3445 domain-containing protein [Candidatus Sericytochromatia bacterium]|nr:DUF3445 domain-containing protein [Candidatus Sericytochromatia bacterium]